MTTLTGDLGALVGDLGQPLQAWVIPAASHIVDGGQVRLGSIELDLLVGDTFTVNLPDGFYRVQVRYYDPAAEDRRTWLSGTFELDGVTLDLADAVTTTWAATRPATNHGNVTGAVTLDASSGAHGMNLTGDTTLTPSGPVGSDLVVRAHLNGHTLDLDGALWDADLTPQLPDPATISMVNFDPDGWIAFAVGATVEPTEVTPEEPTFNIGDGTVTIPAVTGVRYRINGTITAAGVHGSQEGVTTVTAEPSSSAYFFPVGADDEWVDTFPGWSAYVEDAFTGSNGSISGHVPNVTPNSAAWSTGGSPDFVAIASNAIKQDAGAFNPTATLAIPSHTTALGVAIDVVSMAQQVDTSLPTIRVKMLSPDNNEDLALVLAFQDATDDLTLTIAAGNGAGNVTLTGTTTGLPTSGRYGFRWIAADRSIRVTLDGDEIATGTTAVPTFPRDMEAIRLEMVFCKNSSFDNLTVEEHSA